MCCLSRSTYTAVENDQYVHVSRIFFAKGPVPSLQERVLERRTILFPPGALSGPFTNHLQSASAEPR
jgi:hypothetical protein